MTEVPLGIARGGSVAQDNAENGIIDLQADTIIFDEPKLPSVPGHIVNHLAP
jgi:hypothetical protein